MSGWIKLYRKIREGPLWNEKPFDKARAWIDIIMSANHEPRKFMLGNEMVEVDRGSFITSEHKLMERWGWSKSKVRSFLHLLEIESMIIKKTDHKKTTLEVLNYCIYQDSETTEEPQKNHEQTVKRPRKDPNKNYKELKEGEEDIPYAEIVDYLNLKAKTRYRATGKKTKDLIYARWEDKFTLDDFKSVIDKKCASWEGTEWAKFLRPETLFGPKFESYLNEKAFTKAPDKPGDKSQSAKPTSNKYENFYL